MNTTTLPDTDTPKRTWVKAITINNFRHFEKLRVNFDKKLTVLTAANGAGKTTVLDAVAIALGSFVGSFYTGKAIPIQLRDVRLRITNSDLQTMEAQFPCSIIALGEIDGNDIEWGRALNTPKSETTRKEARPASLIGDAMQMAVTKSIVTTLPLIAYYGTGRLWKQKKITSNKTFNSGYHSITAGYQDCLDPASSYKYFEDWFRYTGRANADLREQKREQNNISDGNIETAFSPMLEAVKSAVDKCLLPTGWSNLRWSFTHDAVVMQHKQFGVLEVNQLSDGIRNMVALIADIAYRAVQLNRHHGREAVLKTPGVVLIDEVDMHLHPEWQQVVLRNLDSAFPCMQFIVTTHSPQVLSTVRREQIRIIGEDVEKASIAAQPLARTYGRSNADVLETVMQVSPTPELPENADLDKYIALVEEGKTSDPIIAVMRTRLEAALGSDHPAFIRADMIARRRKALGE